MVVSCKIIFIRSFPDFFTVKINLKIHYYIFFTKYELLCIIVQMYICAPYVIIAMLLSLSTLNYTFINYSAVSIIPENKFYIIFF